MTVRSDSVSLRLTTDDDRELLYRIYESTREEELLVAPWTPEEKIAFCRWQADLQRAHYLEHFPASEHFIVLVDGEPAGRLWIDRRPDTIHVLDIALLAAHRSGGVGAVVMGRLIEEARAKGIAVSVTTLTEGRARKFYERLGLRAVSEPELQVLMEWRAEGASEPSR